MTSRDFAFWLQGFFEINEAGHNKNSKEIIPAQVEIIKSHLSLVFKHEIDPSMGDQKHQDALNQIHFGKAVNQEAQFIETHGYKPSAEHKMTLYGWWKEGEPVMRR